MKAGDLTKAQQEALSQAVFGIEKLRDGYFCQGDPNDRVDGRALQALRRKGLVYWYSTGGAPQIIMIEATEEGHRIFEEELR